MFPFEYKRIEGDTAKELSENFKGEGGGYVHVGPKKWFLPRKYAEHAEKYYTFELKSDDLWIVTYPKSGTTWMQETLWLINNNSDYETASKQPLICRFPFLEYNVIYSEKHLNELRELNKDNAEHLEEIKKKDTPGYVIAKYIKSPRHFKTHLPPSLLPPSLIDTCKVVYLARNPYDVAVSFYHHSKLLRNYDFQGDFKKFWEFFEKDEIIYSPYWEHIKEGWAIKDHPNVLFLFYEDLKRDFARNIRKISKFLNKPITEEQINKLTDHVQIDNFRKNVRLPQQGSLVGSTNKGAQGFIRRGKVGGNEEYNDKEIKQKADKWFKENLSKTDIKFPPF